MAVIQGINECSGEALLEVVKDGLKAEKQPEEIVRDLADTFQIEDQAMCYRIFTAALSSVEPYLTRHLLIREVAKHPDFQFADKKLRTDPEIIRAAIKRDGK